MAVKEKIIDGVALLSVSGKLMGGDETLQVHEHVKSLIAEGIKKVVIDLSRVKWLNSQGLGILMACYTSLSRVEGKLRLAGVTDKVKSLLMITQLLNIFDTYETADRAIANFK